MEHGDMWRRMRKQFSEMADTIDGALRKVPGVGSLVRGPYPPVNVYEGADEIVVRADMPGVAREDLELNLRAYTLTIRGKTQPADYEEDYTCCVREHEPGEFSREVALPATVDEEAEIAAVLRDGVLTVRLKKKEPEQGRTIEVEVS